MSHAFGGRLLPARLLIVAALVGGLLSIAFVSVPKAEASTFAQRVLQVAQSKRGTPYRWGATGPRAFDCSGYTRWVYQRVGVRLPRTAQQQYGATRHIRKSQIRPADLVFFYSRGHIYHVGIYAGRGMIWDAPRPGRTVRLEHIWTSSWVAGQVRR